MASSVEFIKVTVRRPEPKRGPHPEDARGRATDPGTTKLCDRRGLQPSPEWSPQHALASLQITPVVPSSPQPRAGRHTGVQ
jgi:hypothetical protein